MPNRQMIWSFVSYIILILYFFYIVEGVLTFSEIDVFDFEIYFPVPSN